MAIPAHVHDLQYLDEELPARPTDTLVDWVVTPTRTIEIERKRPKPRGIDWQLLDPVLLRTVPPLQELERRAPTPRS